MAWDQERQAAAVLETSRGKKYQLLGDKSYVKKQTWWCTSKLPA